MNERLYIKDLLKELDYKKSKTIVNWCEKNGVGVFSDIGTNRRYVIKEEFLYVKMKQAQKYIKKKYGKNNIQEIFNSNKNTSYTPKGDYEMKFLNYLQNT